MTAPVPVSSTPSDKPDDLDFVDILRTVWRGKLWIVLGGCVGLALAVLMSLKPPVPLYAATSTVGFHSPVSGQVIYQATLVSEEAILTSYTVLDQLVTKLDLMSDPEFNPAFIPGAAAASYDPAVRETVIARLNARISVVNLRQTYVFNVTAVSEDAAKAARIATGVAELYVQAHPARPPEIIEDATIAERALAGEDNSELLNEFNRLDPREPASPRFGPQMFSQALVPQAPYNTSDPRFAILGMIALGLGVAIAAVLIREIRQNTYRSGQALARATGLPVLAQVPEAVLGQDVALAAYVETHPKSAVATAIRALRISVLQAGAAPRQVILCMGSVPQEGAAEIAAALAGNLAGLDRSVLMIQAAATQAQSGVGAAQLLAAECALDKAVVRSQTPGLDILPLTADLGPLADVFARPTFASMLETARQSYDHIILVGAPLLVMPDARLLGQMADVVVHVVRWDATDRGQLDEALRDLETVGVRPTGLVLSRVSPAGMRRYGHDRSHGAFGRFGQSYYES